MLLLGLTDVPPCSSSATQSTLFTQSTPTLDAIWTSLDVKSTSCHPPAYAAVRRCQTPTSGNSLGFLLENSIQNPNVQYLQGMIARLKNSGVFLFLKFATNFLALPMINASWHGFLGSGSLSTALIVFPFSVTEYSWVGSEKYGSRRPGWYAITVRYRLLLSWKRSLCE